MKRMILSVFVLISLTGTGFSQKQGRARIDSLLARALWLPDDSAKVMLLNDLCASYNPISPDSGLKYGLQANALAERLGLPEEQARALSVLGESYNLLFDYPDGIESYLKANLIYTRLGNKAALAENYSNMAGPNVFMGNFQKAVEYAETALRLHQELDNTREVAADYLELGRDYSWIPDYRKSQEYLNRAIPLSRQSGDSDLMNMGVLLQGRIYMADSEYSKALESFKRGLSWFNDHPNTNNESFTLYLIALAYEKLNNMPQTIRYLKESLRVSEAANNLRQKQGAYQKLTDIYESRKEYRAALDAYKKYSEVFNQVFTTNQATELTRHELEYDFETRQLQDSLRYAQVARLHESKLHRQRSFTYSISGTSALICIFLFVAFRQSNRLSREKKYSDELLLNILPSETATELKAKGTARARRFDLVTVMFTNFKDFVTESERLSPDELVSEINYYYTEFDAIITRFGIEKIKTIGDSYMCAGGLPVPNFTHAEDMVKAGLEIQEFIARTKAERLQKGKPFFELRVGIHTGPVVAGIVGIKKFAYDIWGDTVNTASRMERSGETGRVNISKTTYDLVKDQFVCEYRGKIEAKNKGEIDMYFVKC